MNTVFEQKELGQKSLKCAVGWTIKKKFQVILFLTYCALAAEVKTRLWTSPKGDSSDDYLGLDVSCSLILNFRKDQLRTCINKKKYDLTEASSKRKGGNVILFEASDMKLHRKRKSDPSFKER